MADLERQVVGLASSNVLYFAKEKGLIDSLPIKEHILLFVRYNKCAVFLLILFNTDVGLIGVATTKNLGCS